MRPELTTLAALGLTWDQLSRAAKLRDDDLAEFTWGYAECAAARSTKPRLWPAPPTPAVPPGLDAPRAHTAPG